MKFVKYFIIVGVFLLSIMLSQCDKTDSILSAKMEAKIDNTEWKSITRVTNLIDDKFTITGTSVSGEIISITVFGKTTGTYELKADFTSIEFAAFYKPDVSSTTENYVASSGIVEITEIDSENNKISGTFHFDAYKNLTEKISITDGSFDDLKYVTN